LKLIITYGSADATVIELAHKNFIKPPIDPHSLCCTPIELLSKDGNDSIISTATGFFWKHGNQAYLITNWHVLSGRNPFTGEILDQGYTPSRINCYGTSIDQKNGQISIERKRLTISLGPHMEKILEKPPILAGNPIDIAAIMFPNELIFGRDESRAGFIGANAASCFINEKNQRILTQAGDDCFIIGYPLQTYTGGMFPIWKRGSIASDISFGVDNRPIFLVDAATTSGMSGSPILRRATTITANNQDIGAIQEFHAYEFIGVYAGRLKSKELAATNLGYAWYQILIPDVINSLESALVAEVQAAL
jgi:hypothetical protein